MLYNYFRDITYENLKFVIVVVNFT